MLLRGISHVLAAAPRPASTESHENPRRYGRAWAWTTWSADVPLPATPGPVKLLARAHDLGGGAQPRTPADVWNIRGLNNNSWHSVTLGRLSN